MARPTGVPFPFAGSRAAMLNNDLDIERHRLALRRNGRVQITDFLQPEAAERLRRCLVEEVPWSTAERGQPDDTPGWDAATAAAPTPALHARAREGFHFVYDRYLIVEAMKAGRDPGLLLHVVLQFFNSPQYLDFIRYFTGERDLNMVGAQATRYRPGQFLRLHDDKHDEEGRRYAYVVNLSRGWEADWGGLLHFTDAEGRVTDTFLPLFNSLSLFRVPANHHVSLVAPWALDDRLSITGWWHAKGGA